MKEYFMHPATHKLSLEESGDENERILRSKGYVKVSGYEEAREEIKKTSMFSRKVLGFRPKDDALEAYVTESPVSILLSRDKILANPIIQSALSTMFDSLASDPALVEWWSKKPTYVRGSPLAQKAMQLFHLSQSQLELLVISCRQ